MILLLILVFVILIFSSNQSRRLKEMKKESPVIYKFSSCFAYGVIALIPALTAQTWWVITISWLIVVICLIVAADAIAGSFKKKNPTS